MNSGIRPEGTEITQENKYMFSQYQVRSFAAQGMKLTNEGGTTKLLYKKNGKDNEWVAVVGSEHAGEGISVKEALNDYDFRIPYTAAAKGWRGGNSGWYDTMMNNITTAKLAINRNRWVSYTARNTGKMSEEFIKLAEGNVLKNTSDAEVTSSKEMSVEEYEASGLEEGSTVVPYEGEAPEGGIGYWDSNTGVKQNGEALSVTKVEMIPKVDSEGNAFLDANGNEIPDKYLVTASNDDYAMNNITDVSDLDSKMMNKALNVSNAAKSAVDVVDGACAGIEGLTAIYTVVSAYQTLQYLNLVSGFMESVDKMKAGLGDQSPIHEYSTNLTVKADTVVAEGDPVSNTSPKTAMESKGMAMLFSGTPIDSNDASVRNVNFESVMADLTSLTGAVSITAKTYEMCGYAKIASGVANLTMTMMSFIPIVGQAAMATQVAMKIGMKVAVGAVVQTFFAAVIPVIAKKVINSIVKNVATEWFGEDLGNALLASKYFGGNGTSGGQGPGGAEKVLAYLGEQQTVIANEAEYQRAVRSPFDITSPYTFLGSLAYSLIPMAYSSGGVANMVTGMSVLTGNSIAAISPGASAVDLNRKIDSVGESAFAGNVGAVVDAFGNPYIITDVATIEQPPAEVDEQVKNIDSGGTSALNEDGSVNNESNLEKYIVYCGQRTSQYGIKDSGIVDKLQGSIEKKEDGFWEKLKNAAGKIVGLVPGISDTQNVLEGLKDVDLLQWATGEACVVSDENEYWEENKVYQRYAENERLLESINPGYTSPVTAYLEKYYEENPIDTSFEGTLARFSGKSKDEVESTLALIVYYDELAKYNPNERYAFIERANKGVELKFNNENAVAKNVYYILPNEIIFADVRNRQNVTA